MEGDKIQLNKKEKKNNKKRIVFNHVIRKGLIIKVLIIWTKMKRTFLENKRFVSRGLLVWKRFNIIESASGDPRGQDTEEVLINFWEEELGYVNVGTVEIKRVHLPGNEAKRYWRRTASNTGMISSL